MRVFSVVCLVAVFFALVPGLCDGAEVGVKVKVPVDTRKIDVRYVRNKSGNRVSDRGGSSGGNKWARVAVTFDSFPEYIDELEVRYYLLCKDGKTMLTGSQVCMYVKRGRSHVTTIYAFPNAVEKFGGEIVGVVAEFFIDGKFVLRSVYDKSAKKMKEDRWWEELPEVTGALTNWHGTPFRNEGAHKQEALRLE